MSNLAHSRRQRVLFLMTFLVHAGLLLPGLVAAEHVPEHARRFLDAHCVSCHGPEKAKAQLRLDTLSADLSGPSRRIWYDVLEAVHSGQMPPESKPRPSTEDQSRMVSWLSGALTATIPTVPRLRRLGRTELDLALNDVLGFDPHIDFTDRLPPDPSSGGFDNAGEDLSVPPERMMILMEVFRYALDRALPSGAKPTAVRKEVDLRSLRTTQKKPDWIRGFFPNGATSVDDRIMLTHVRGHAGAHLFDPREDGLALYPYLHGSNGPSGNPHGVLRPAGVARVLDAQIPAGPTDGLLRCKIRAWALQGQSTPRLAALITVSGASTHRLAWDITGTKQEPQEFTVILPWHSVGATSVNVGLRNDQGVSSVADKQWATGVKQDPKTGVVPFPLSTWDGISAIVVESVEVELPWNPVWPAATARAICAPDADESTASKAITRFMERAWRRPVAFSESERVIASFRACRAAGADTYTALRQVLRAVLLSPGFLYLPNGPVAQDPDGQHACAARLAAFLWLGQPDETLRGLAASGTLADPKVRESEALRMLSAPQAKRFVHTFMRQWLDLDQASEARAKDGPTMANDDLWEAIQQQPDELFAHLLREDLSVMDLVEAPYAVINEPLADHYGMPNVSGSQFRAVPLPIGNQRGGLFGTSALLMAMTGPHDEAVWPIFRGAYVFRRILGHQLPDPPSDVPPITDAVGTGLRDRLSKHQSDPSCAACHARFDPIGYGLQNFDAIGRWRTTQNGTVVELNKDPKKPKISRAVKEPCDTVGTMPGGHSFKDFIGMRGILGEQLREVMLRAFARRMLAFARGRKVTVDDAPALDRLVAEWKTDGCGVRSLVVRIVTGSDFSPK